MRLPPERLFAEHLVVGRSTVASAYELLAAAGLVERRQGRGTQVTGRPGSLVSGRASELATSLQRNVLFRHLGEPSEDTIDLLAGSAPPSPRVRKALAEAVDGLDIDTLASDSGYFPLGHPPLRRAAAAHMTALGHATTEDEVLVTGGAQQALSLLAGYYAGPGTLVVLEDPTFPGAVDAFRTAGARILTVPVGEAGADVELLETTVAESPVRAVYVMPSFHNPTGVLMSEEGRRNLVRLSRATGTAVVEDNTLAELALRREPPRALGALAGDAPIVTVGSLSKLFWGGLRVGWIRAPHSTIAQLGRLKAVADLGTSLVSQAVAANLLSRVEEIRTLRRGELVRRLAVLEELLGRSLPGWTWREPKGGLSLWVRLPHGSATELAQLAGRRGVLIAPGSVMSVTGRFDDYVRLPFDHDEPHLAEGVRRLAAAWESYGDALGKRPSKRLGVVV